jgi:hypothetical protein
MFKDFGRRRSRGQSLVEFALVVPVLLVILLGGIDMGRLYFGWVNLNNAARIAANYAAVNTAGPFGAGSAYETTVKNDTGGINCAALAVPPPVFSPNTNVGSTATVTMTCSFGLVFPFVGPIPMAATSTFPVRGGTIAGVPNPPAPPCVVPPDWITPSYVGQKVKAARDSWEASGGTFLPSGANNDIVIGQVPDVGTCAIPGALMVVTHQNP